MLRIKGLQVRHIRGAKRVDIHTPDEAMVEIAGRNGAGKSSALDAVEWGLRGKRALPEDPLYHGATRGHVEMDLGDLHITRSITDRNVARGGTVRIEARDGSKWGQRDLDELFGAWTFDPLAFARMRPEEQVSRIRALAGREFAKVLDDLEAHIAKARQDRADAGRLERSFGRLDEPEYVAEVDVTELLEQLREAHAHNAAQSHLAQQAAARDARIESALARLTVAREAFDRAALALDAARSEYEAQLESQDVCPAPPVDTAALEARLAGAQEANAKHDAYKRAMDRFRDWQHACRKHAELSEMVSDLEEKRRQHLRTAQLPVDGLSWEGSRIALDGTPFSGLSTTEQLLLSARIGMAMSPDLRVMLVREGGLIDSEKFQALRDLAQSEGYQVWIETAGEGHTPDALVIMAGELSDSPQDEWTE